MVTSSSRQGDSSAIAVIRHFQPTRIERELLAQVFEMVSHRAGADCVGREGATLFTGTLRVVDHSSIGHVEQVAASPPEQREQIA